MTSVAGLAPADLRQLSFHDPRKAPAPSGGIVCPGYGRAYAAAIPASAFTLLPRSGHLPQAETPEERLETHRVTGAEGLVRAA